MTEGMIEGRAACGPLAAPSVGRISRLSYHLPVMRNLAVAAAFTLTLAACGGRDDSSSDDGPSFDDIIEAADTLVDRFGDDVAFFVTAISLDQGYSAGQIVDSAWAVGADGTIPQVPAAHEPWGLTAPADESQTSGGPPRGAGIAPLVPPADTDETLGDTKVQFLGASLGEIWVNAGAHIARQDAYSELKSVSDRSLPVIAIISLAATGYSPDQILEALLFDQWARQGSNGCTVIDNGKGIVTPQLKTRFADVQCRNSSGTPLFVTATTSTTTTTGSDVPNEPGDSALDGTYNGTAQWLEMAGGYEFVETAVHATVTDGVIDIQIGFTISWPRRSADNVPTCVTTVRSMYRGSATVTAGEFTVPMMGVSQELVNAVGSTCEGVEGELIAEWEADTASAVPLTAQLGDGVLAGTFWEGAVGITATRD